MTTNLTSPDEDPRAPPQVGQPRTDEGADKPHRNLTAFPYGPEHNIVAA